MTNHVNYEETGAEFEAWSGELLRKTKVDGKPLTVSFSTQKFSKWDKRVKLPCGLSFLWQDKDYKSYWDKETETVVDVNKVRREQLRSYFQYEKDTGQRMLMFCRDKHLYTMQDVLSLINEMSMDNCFNTKCFSWFPRESGVYYVTALAEMNKRNTVPLKFTEWFA